MNNRLNRLTRQLKMMVTEAEAEAKGNAPEFEGKPMSELHGVWGIWRTSEDGHKIFIGKDPKTGKDTGIIYSNPHVAAAAAGVTAEREEDFNLFSTSIPEFKIKVVAGEDGKLSKEDIDRAIEVKKRLSKGIDEAADFCKFKPSVCKGNLGITRDSMPQIMDDPISKMLKSDKPEDRKKAEAAVAAGADPNETRPIKELWVDHLEKKGIKITDEEVPVGRMRASQAEIKALKSYDMAESQLRGYDKKKNNRPTDFTQMPLLVTREKDENGEDVYTVIDGHHRFAAMLLVDPEAKQKVRVINAPIRDALEQSFDLPGVFRADLQDNIVSMDKPLDLAREEGSTWKQRNGKFYGKNRRGKNGGPYKTEEAAKKFATRR
jgi:hypothetical protein